MARGDTRAKLEARLRELARLRGDRETRARAFIERTTTRGRFAALRAARRQQNQPK
jgi:hypothetical protein